MRIVNLAFASTLNPQLVSFPVFFTWALITLCVHRLFLHIRAAEVRLALEEKHALAVASQEDEPDTPVTPARGIFVLNGRASPFGLPLALGIHHDDDMHDFASKVPVTMVDIQSFYR